MQISLLESQSQAVGSTSSTIYHRIERGLQSAGRERKLMVPRCGSAQGVKWLRAVMLVTTSVNDIPVSQSTAPFACPYPASASCEQLTNPTERWFAFSVSNWTFLALQQWDWPVGSTTQFDLRRSRGWGQQKKVCRVLNFWRTGLKRLKQCSRHSWDQRKGKKEDTNSHNKKLEICNWAIFETNQTLFLPGQ